MTLEGEDEPPDGIQSTHRQLNRPIGMPSLGSGSRSNDTSTATDSARTIHALHPRACEAPLPDRASTAAPSYHSSLGIGSTPSYSRQARPTERSLGSNVPHFRPTSMLHKIGRYFTVTFAGQEEGADAPSYGRGGLVDGQITLTPAAATNVLKLQVKIEGELKLVIAEGGSVTHSLLNHTIPLFYSVTPSECTTKHTFSFRLPRSFQDGDARRPLPPSYEVNFSGVPGVRAVVKYWVGVKLVRKKVWKRKEIVDIPFQYAPRVRPPQPLLGMTLLSSLKSHPEEWSLFSSDVLPRSPDSSDSVITSSFVLPSTTVFPLSRNIPFHLQLSLSHPSPPNDTTTATNSTTTASIPSLTVSPPTTEAASPSPETSHPNHRSSHTVNGHLRPPTPLSASSSTVSLDHHHHALSISNSPPVAESTVRANAASPSPNLLIPPAASPPRNANANQNARKASSSGNSAGAPKPRRIRPPLFGSSLSPVDVSGWRNGQIETLRDSTRVVSGVSPSTPSASTSRAAAPASASPTTESSEAGFGAGVEARTVDEARLAPKKDRPRSRSSASALSSFLHGSSPRSKSDSTHSASGNNLPPSANSKGKSRAQPLTEADPNLHEPQSRRHKAADQNNFRSKISSVPSPTLLAPLLTKGATIKVTLQRQIVVDVRNQRVLKTVVCGEGEIRRVRLGGGGEGSSNGTSTQNVRGRSEARGSGSRATEIPESARPEAPPSYGANGHAEPAFAHLDQSTEEYTTKMNSISEEPEQDQLSAEWAGWEGEVVPREKQISVGGFRAAGLAVRDFIILTLIPPDPEHSPLRAHQHAVPVRLVTDAWDEEEG